MLTLARKITLLNRVTLKSLSDPDEKSIIKRFTDLGIEILEADFGFAWYKPYEQQDFHLIYKSKHTPYTPAKPRRFGTQSKVDQRQSPLFINDVLKSRAVREDAKKFMKSVAVIPIVYRSRTYGTIDICFKRMHKFVDEDESIATALGNSAAQALTIHRVESHRAWLAKIVESSEDAIFSVDLKGNILSWNKGAEKLYGYSEKDVIGRSARMLIPSSYLQESKKLYDKLIKGIEILSYEMVHVVNGGKRVPVSISVSPIIDASGKIFALSVIARDITQRRHIERESKKLLRQKDEFLSIASHELKTPITTIRGFSQILQNKIGPNNKELDGLISKIIVQNDRLSRLVNDLLDVSRMETGKLKLNVEAVDLNKLTREIVEEISLTHKSHEIEIHGRLEKRVKGDRDRIGQVVANLLINAIKYSPKADRIIVRVSNFKEMAEVSVQDFGIGISQKNQKKIFERFFQEAGFEGGAFPGLGLGLYISQKIVKLHGGTMRVESRQGKGATFYFTIPLVNE